MFALPVLTVALWFYLCPDLFVTALAVGWAVLTLMAIQAQVHIRTGVKAFVFIDSLMTFVTVNIRVNVVAEE